MINLVAFLLIFLSCFGSINWIEYSSTNNKNISTTSIDCLPWSDILLTKLITGIIQMNTFVEKLFTKKNVFFCFVHNLPGVQWKYLSVFDKRDWEINPITKSEYFSAYLTAPISMKKLFFFERYSFWWITNFEHKLHYQWEHLWKTFAQSIDNLVVHRLILLPNKKLSLLNNLNQ